MKRGDFDWNWDSKTYFSLDDCKEQLLEDKLNRRKYAEYLYYYLEQKGKSNNTVINLNAEWGAGKSYFLKRFYNSIKDVHPCVYIDAWKQDFSDDAFLTLFSSLSQQLQAYSGDLDSRLIQCGQAIGRFTKGVIPAVLSGLMKNYIGVDSVGDIAKEASELMLKEHQEKLKSIQTLKEELALWARLSFENKFSGPIFIFIDELDRCRPDYAITLLEIVKHIFDIENFVFLIATDTDQLQHSIKNIYGNDFSANDYLGRFFHRRFTLKSPELRDFIDGIIENKLSDDFVKYTSYTYPLSATAGDFAGNIAAVFEAFNLNLRDAIRNTERLIDILKYVLTDKKLDYILLLSLMIIYDRDRIIIESQVGRRPIEQKFIDLIKSSINLKGASQANLHLKIDTSQIRLGVNYVRIHGHGRRMIEQINPNINLSLVSYLEVSVSFINNMKSLKNDFYKDRTNSLITFSQNYNQSSLTGHSAIKYLQGTMLETEDDLQLYSFSNYVELIELATSFD